jgi:hypothetical protein
MSPAAEYRNGLAIGTMYAPRNTPDWYLGFCTGLWIGTWQWWLRQWGLPS